MNLLDYFALRHTQLTHLNAELREQISTEQRIQAKVELNLTPHEMTVQGGGEMPTYQIATTLTCKGESEPEQKTLFILQISMQAAYQQVKGEPLSFEDFKHQHTPLTRQLYPLAHQHLRTVMLQLGLEHVRLPFDLINQSADEQLARSLH